MGVNLRINGGKRINPSRYQVSESSTPLAGGDSSGGTGLITFDVPSIPRSRMLIERPVAFSDSSRGSTLGKIRKVGESRQSGIDSFEASTRLGEFMIETTVQPFRGTLEQAFAYYCSLANINTDILVDDAIKTRVVAFPGWSGNLWLGMKEMATGQGADLNLVSDVILLRPIRTRIAVADRETDARSELDNGSIAQKQEVIWYDTQSITNALVYPPGGWDSSTRTLAGPAGEVSEFVIELEAKRSDNDNRSPAPGASVSSIQQPVMQLFVDKDYTASSVYTITGDDNIPVTPSQWAAYGGKLEVFINPDTTSLTVRMTAPSGITQVNGEQMKTYRIGLSSGSSSSTYSTLRIVGTGVRLNQQTIILSTGVEAYRTAQEFAPSIDTKFLNTINDAYSAGVRGARRHAGRTFSLSATVTAINRRGDSGSAKYPAYSFVQSRYSGQTYNQVKTAIAPKTYGQMRSDLFAEVRDDFENQLFGNAPGARYYDRKSERWYRIRRADTAWDVTSIQADDDLLFSDIQGKLGGQTYGQVKTAVAGKTYFYSNIAGLGLAA